VDREVEQLIEALLGGVSPTQIKEWPKKIDQLREVMCTLPERQGKREDEVYFGARHIKVELVDYPENPYKAIYTMVTSTWSSRHEWWKRWEKAEPEGRLLVVISALSRQTLPQCLEAATFTFKIQGLSRAAFDQLARHRHAGIGSVGSRDNSHLDAALVLPNTLKPFEKELREWWKLTKDLYEKIIKQGQRTWQCARFILPHGMEWRFTWCLNYRGFQDVCAQRLNFCEQWDTVATTWLMWKRLHEKFPLLAAFCRPGCDWAKRCTYAKAYTLSELFSCLFKPCGRWPTGGDYTYAEFNEASTNIEELEKELGFHIPRPNEWNDIVKDAIKKDFKYFEEE